MPANSIPDTNFQPDYNWTASQSAPLVTVSQEEWNEWMRKNMEYRASLNLSGDKHPPKTFTDPSDSHLQDSLKGMGDFYPQDPSTDDPEDSHPQEPTSEPGASHLQDPFSKSGTDAEKFSESVKTGLGQPDSVSPESPESSGEEERSGLSKGVTLLLALIVIQLVIILIILCKKRYYFRRCRECFCIFSECTPYFLLSLFGNSRNNILRQLERKVCFRTGI